MSGFNSKKVIRIIQKSHLCAGYITIPIVRRETERKEWIEIEYIMK